MMAVSITSGFVVWLNFYVPNDKNEENCKKVLVHREKTSIPNDIAETLNLELLKRKLLQFAGVHSLAAEKGLGRNIEAALIRTQRRPGVSSSVESFSIRTQAQWDYERQKLDASSYLQGRSSITMLQLSYTRTCLHSKSAHAFHVYTSESYQFD